MKKSKIKCVGKVGALVLTFVLILSIFVIPVSAKLPSDRVLQYDNFDNYNYQYQGMFYIGIYNEYDVYIPLSLVFNFIDLSYNTYIIYYPFETLVQYSGVEMGSYITVNDSGFYTYYTGYDIVLYYGGNEYVNTGDRMWDFNENFCDFYNGAVGTEIALRENFQSQINNRNERIEELENTLTEVENYYLDYIHNYETTVVPELRNDSYMLGFSDGMDYNNGFVETVKTIFSSPMYMINQVLNFNFFGVNLYDVFTLFLTICVVAFVIKFTL